MYPPRNPRLPPNTVHLLLRRHIAIDIDVEQQEQPPSNAEHTRSRWLSSRSISYGLPHAVDRSTRADTIPSGTGVPMCPTVTRRG